MSTFKFSNYIYKMLGFSEEESKLILRRNNEYGDKRIMTTDSKLLQSKRYEGLSEMDKMLAEHAHNEFGHLTDPVLAFKLKYSRRNHQ